VGGKVIRKTVVAVAELGAPPLKESSTTQTALKNYQSQLLTVFKCQFTLLLSQPASFATATSVYLTFGWPTALQKIPETRYLARLVRMPDLPAETHGLGPFLFPRHH
jgi:hypothetical protein